MITSIATKPSSVMKIIASLLILNNVHAFSGYQGVPSGAHRIQPSVRNLGSPTMQQRTRPLFVVSNEQQNAEAIKRLDLALEKEEKRRQKVVEELNKANARLQAIRSEKQTYLDGGKLGDTPPGGTFTETALRSAVKAFCWRLIAGSVTFITSMRFSGSITTALTIVGSDFFSKAATMFIGERLMNKSSAGRGAGADNVGRSLAKALLWRLFAICNTLTMAFFIAKDLSMASKIAGSDAIFKTGLMFFYERAWANVEWGKEYQIEFSI
mmetsp:Transcript_30201/g.44413  ORF Transcript_30201/g.44413 Transcript_30201/m.44413 type:complete len:268 (-) Transcript_30201:332-1135(-)